MTSTQKTNQILLGTALCFALTGTAFGQIKTTDIVGIKIGMTADEVKAALKKHIPDAKLNETKYLATPDGNLPASTSVLGAASSSSDSSDAIEVKFLRTTDKAYSIVRQVRGPKIGLTDQVQGAFVEKYGPPTSRNPSVLRWVYLADNTTMNPQGGCEPMGNSMLNPKCGMFFKADFLQGNNVISRYEVTMFDTQSIVRDLKNLKEIENLKQAAKVKALDGTRPKL